MPNRIEERPDEDVEKEASEEKAGFEVSEGIDAIRARFAKAKDGVKEEDADADARRRALQQASRGTSLGDWDDKVKKAMLDAAAELGSDEEED